MGMRIPKTGPEFAIMLLGVGLFCILQAFVMTPASTALDNPHISSNSVGCDNCHNNPASLDFENQASTDPAKWGVCGQCHNSSWDATYVKPHVSPTYGNVIIQCTECHNPHSQNQSRVYKAASYVQTGTLDTALTAVTSTTLKLSASLPAPPAGTTSWVGFLIMPDKRYPAYIYRIDAYDPVTNTITIDTGSNGTEMINTLIKPGAGYAIVYGKLIKDNIWPRTVRFFRPEGANSFADGDAVIDGVCQVCHTQTKYFDNTGTKIDAGHPEPAGKKCVTCHTHLEQFQGGCTSCHGYPPDGPATLVFKDKNSVPVTSDSPGAGAHVRHKDAGYTCFNCHTGGMLGGASQGDDQTNIGFNLNSSNLGGNYDGKSPRTTYPYAGGGTTTVSAGNTIQCSNVYCHSSGQAADGGAGGPVFATPQWNDPATGACGTCHKVTEASGLTSGSHGAHLGAAGVNGCGDCHTGAADDASSYVSQQHVDMAIDVANSYTAGGPLGNGYGTCSTASCHDNGTGTAVVTPTWGTAVNDCSECHATQPATGSHTKHLTGLAAGFNRNAVCGDCHDGAVEGTTAPSTHLDGNLDVFGTTAGDLGYPLDVAKGGAPYNSCNTAYCHSNGFSYSTVTWGNLSTGCNFCHSALPATGAHARHVATAATSYGSTAANTSGSPTSYDFGCGNCHPVNTANHMNGSVDISLNPADGGTLKSRNSSPTKSGSGTTTQCNGVYCHSDGKAAPTFVQTPQWGSSFANSWNTCGSCHGNSPAGSNHTKHIVGIHYKNIYTGTTGLAGTGTLVTNSHGNAGASTTINCNVCHNSTVTKSRNKYGSVCASCHSGDTDNTTNAMVSADLTKTAHVNGQPDVAFAVIQVKTRAQVRDDITTVAELNNSWTRPAGSYKTGATPNDTAKNALNTAAMWNGETKSCSNIACHNGNSATWTGMTVKCNSCHTALP